MGSDGALWGGAKRDDVEEQWRHVVVSRCGCFLDTAIERN